MILTLMSIPSTAQVQPCLSGSLANVLGTSCSIGNVTFIFANNFGGFHQIDDASNTLQTTLLPPSVIGFVPVTTGNQAGFTLVANFDEVTDPFTQPFSTSAAHFSYSVQVTGDLEITGETVSASGTTTQIFEDFFGASESHCFTNQFCMLVGAGATFLQNSGFSSQLTSSATLGIPGVASLPDDPSGLGFTTSIGSSAFAGDHAVFNSATFLYTVVPQAPLPPLAKLSYKNIDVPGEVETDVGGINDAGDIVGAFIDAAGMVHGYLQNKNGLQEIAAPNAISTAPAAINNRGDMTGTFTGNDNVRHGFVFVNGVFTTLDFPGAISTFPFGINDHGVIVGTYQLTRFGLHAFRFDENGFVTIDDPDQDPSGLTEALGVNNSGDVAGLFLDQQFNSHAFLLSHNTFNDIQVPGGFQPSGGGLNNSASIIGSYEDVNQFVHGFLKEGNRFRTVDFPDSSSNFPFGINTRGQIVGLYIDADGAFHSFLAEPVVDDGKQEKPADTSGRTPPGRGCSGGDDLQRRHGLRNPHSCPVK